MLASAYIDTSVLGAYYCSEAVSVKAEAVLRGVEAPVISGLSEVEFCSLIYKKRRLKELTERQAREVLDLFATHVAEGYYRRMTLLSEHYLAARQLIASMESTLHTLDALHLAAALSESLSLVTADQQLAAAAKRHKSKVILVK
jgi:predicted nucleic acid-binding protein